MKPLLSPRHSRQLQHPAFSCGEEDGILRGAALQLLVANVRGRLVTGGPRWAIIEALGRVIFRNRVGSGGSDG